MPRHGYVSLERVCEHCTIARYHPSGGGIRSPHSFIVDVVLVDGCYWFKGARGSYARAVSRAIRQALSRAGFPRIKRLSGFGARERTITTEALPFDDLPPWIGKENVMSDLKYSVTAKSADRIAKGQKGFFSWEFTNSYEGMGEDDAQATEQASNAIDQAIADNADPDGELTVTLKSWVDGAEQAPLTYQMTRPGLSQAQIEIFTSQGAKEFLAQGHAKQKAKAAGWRPPKDKKDGSELLGVSE